MRSDFTFSDQQFAAITAPLAPAVVIAGAGSGKTTVMAARVVWLVATGQVAPGRGAGADLHHQGDRRARRRHPGGAARGRTAARPRRGDDEVEEPTVATYHSYAAGLLTEHGLRIGHEPDTRLIADASRYQLAARAVQRYRAPVPHLTESPDHAVRYLLALDAEMTEHLVAPDDVRRVDARGTASSSWRGWRTSRARRTASATSGDPRDRPPRRPARAGRGLPAAEARPRPGRLQRPDRPGGVPGPRAARGGAAGAREVQGGAARRVPGHLRRPGHHAEPAVLGPAR